MLDAMRPLHRVDDALDRLKLLCQVRARPAFGAQAENAVDLSAHLLQLSYDVRM
jgi:hypothetical protein